MTTMPAFLCGFNGFNQLTTHSCTDSIHTMDNPNPILTTPTKMQLELYDHKNSANHNSELSRTSEIKSVAVSWSNVYLVHDEGSVSVTGHLQDTWQNSDIVKSLSELKPGIVCDNAIEYISAAWDRVFIINKRGECMVYKSTVEATRSHLEGKRKSDELQESECNDTGTRKKVFKARNRLIRESLPEVRQPESLDNENLVQNTTSVNQLCISSCDNAAKVNENDNTNSVCKLNSDSVNPDLYKVNSSLEINTSSCSSSVDLSSDSVTNAVMNSSQSKLKVRRIEANDKYAVIATKDNKLYTYPIKQAEKSSKEDEESQVPDTFQPLDHRLIRSISLDGVISSISCGKQFALLCTTQGHVYSFGSGGHGELGHGNLENQSEPRMVEMLEGVFVTCVAAGGWHSLVRGKCGELYVWGWNERGQLGLPSRGVSGKDDRELSSSGYNSKDSQDLNCDSVESSCEREMKSKKTNDEEFVNVIPEPQLLDIRLNPACNLSKFENSISINTANDDFVEVSKIACGSRHTVALTEDGRVLAWGWNEYGQLGLGDLQCVDKPTVIQFFIDNSITVKDVHAGYWNSVFVM